MKVLVLGGGGRENALVWKLNQSKRIKEVFCIPGNGGINQVAKTDSIAVSDFGRLSSWCKKKKVDLIVVGPEAPLVEGISDYFQLENMAVIGPGKNAAQLEGSKIFSKNFMKKYAIPTAPFNVFADLSTAENYLRSLEISDKKPIVIKADGLAQGKGVAVCAALDQSLEFIRLLMKEKKFGLAGERIIIEEALNGEEITLMAFCDGETLLPMLPSQDHKRIFDEDKGPNTGGRGAYCPATLLTNHEKILIEEVIFKNFLRGLKEEKLEYQGIIYFGLILTAGGPCVLEFNVRFGDPEAQVVLPLLQNDLCEVFLALKEKRLREIELKWSKKSTVCVILTSDGYPGDYPKGKLIKGLDKVAEQRDVAVFHSGTTFEEGNFYTNGGRVLGITAWDEDLKEAHTKVYKAVRNIEFEGMHYRKDIGSKGLQNKEEVSVKQ
ncbi:MAG: phosphoribosylamine--glycine ligase [Elusimicrobiota bacterium]